MKRTAANDNRAGAPASAIRAVGVLAAVVSCGGGFAADPPGDLVLPGGGAPALAYVHRAVPYKPYVKHLYSPAGVDVLLDAPPDHLHHHGLMFALRVDGTGFWEERAGAAGTQRTVSARAEGGRIESDLEWLAPDGTNVLVRERRAIRLLTAPAGMTVTAIEWGSEMTLPAGRSAAAQIAGNHYYGLGLRFAPPMNEATEFRFAEGAAKLDEPYGNDETLTRSSPWCAARGAIGGRPVTVAVLDHPRNPRPVTWFTMTRPFAYVAATLHYNREPLALDPGRPLVLRYAVAVWDGAADDAQVQSMLEHWNTNNREK